MGDGEKTKSGRPSGVSRRKTKTIDSVGNVRAEDESEKKL